MNREASHSSDDDDDADGGIDAVVADYLVRKDAGERPDPLEYFAKHPELAGELAQFFQADSKIALLAAFDDSSGARLVGCDFGHFSIVRILGRGGLGIVYEAVDRRSGKPVALKVLSLPASLDSKQLVRFKNEGRTLRMLNHPNIVSILDVGHVNETPYYAMTLIDGCHLGQQIAAWRDAVQEDLAHVPNPVHVAGIVRQIAEALDQSHRLGILHRDVKPSNILLDGQQRPYLADFGLASFPGAASLTLSGDIVGTLRYASPEQILGERATVDERADIYSLGATLWEMLTFRPLINHNDRRQIVHAVLDEDPPTASSTGKGVPYDLETIALACLHKDPSGRYQSAAALVADLRRFEHGESIVAKRPTYGERAARWAKRNRQGAAIMLAALCLVTIASILSTLFVSRAQRVTVAALKQSQVNELRAESNAREALELLYASHVRQASNDWHDNDLATMKAHLDEVPEYDPGRKLRGFEWDMLQTQCQRSSEFLFESTAPIYVIVFSPDGRHFLSAGRDSILRLHDATTGKMVKEVPTEQTEVNQIAFSHDGKRIATAGDNGTVKIWLYETFELLREIVVGHDRVVWTVSFSQDDQVIISTGEQDHLFAAYRVDDGALIGSYDTGGTSTGAVKHVLPLADQTFVTCEIELRRWRSANDGFEIIQSKTVHEWDDFVCHAVADESRRLLVVARRNEGRRGIIVHNLDDLRELASIGFPEFPTLVSLFPQRGMIVACTNSGTVRVFQIDEVGGKFRGIREVDSWLLDKEPFGLTPSPDEQYLLFALGNQIRRTKMRSRKPSDEERIPGRIVGSPFSDAYIHVDAGGVRAGHGLSQPIPIAFVDVAISSDLGRIAGITESDHSLVIWNTTVNAMTCEVPLPHKRLNTLTFSPDGKYVAVRSHLNDGASASSTAKDALFVYHLESNRFVPTNDTEECTAAVFDHGGRIIYKTLSGDIVGRDVLSNDVVWQVQPELIERKYFISIHPTDNLIAVGNSRREIAIRRTETGELVNRIKLSYIPQAMAWSHDGRRAVVFCRDYQMAIVDVRRGEVLLERSTIAGGFRAEPVFIEGGSKLAVSDFATRDSVVIDLTPQETD